MGFRDSAVNGMVGRLVQAGFTPAEGFCLAQAAYIKEDKRDPGVPEPEMSGSIATFEINEALRALGPYAMGPEAHRTRIRLWEKIFGFGSWHEPIPREEIYDPIELTRLRIASGARVFAAYAFGDSDDEEADERTHAADMAISMLWQKVRTANHVWDPKLVGTSLHTTGSPEAAAAIAKFNISPDELDGCGTGRVFALAWLVAFRG